MFKTQVEPPAADECFHCKDLNILTSFLWPVREQTMENCCQFVFFFYSTIESFRFEDKNEREYEI